jgi:hypothetical protein
MHRSVYSIIILLSVLIMAALPGGTAAQESEGYTFLRGISGPEVCVGQYIAPSSADVNGVCQGQVFGLQQFSAVAARQSVDRLDRIAAALEAIDQKLAANNEQMQTLIRVTANAQNEAVTKEISLLSSSIDERFEAIPEELLSNNEFRDELNRLKADIMEEVDKRLKKSGTGAGK